MDEGRYLDFINPQMGRIEILLILGCGHPDFARENLACKEITKMSWNYVLAGMFTVNRQDYQLFTFQERDNNLIIPAHLCLVYKMYLRNLTLQQLRKQMPIYLWTVQKTLRGRGGGFWWEEGGLHLDFAIHQRGHPDSANSRRRAWFCISLEGALRFFKILLIKRT